MESANISPQQGDPAAADPSAAPTAGTPPVTAPEAPTTAPQQHLSADEIRQEFARLRGEVAAARGPQTTAPAPDVASSPETRIKERLKEIADFSHYCPGCGRLAKYARECTGRPEAPHAPIEMVSTDELGEDSDPAGHTRAPATG